MLHEQASTAHLACIPEKLPDCLPSEHRVFWVCWEVPCTTRNTGSMGSLLGILCKFYLRV